jgi:predicted signal transduction protein with EAL and GGDEF domain
MRDSVSTYPEDGEDAEILLKNADTAMYQGKKRGHNNYQFFNQDMNARTIERQTIESDLRGALKRIQIEDWYHPCSSYLSLKSLTSFCP